MRRRGFRGMADSFGQGGLKVFLPKYTRSNFCLLSSNMNQVCMVKIAETNSICSMPLPVAFSLHFTNLISYHGRFYKGTLP